MEVQQPATMGRCRGDWVRGMLPLIPILLLWLLLRLPLATGPREMAHPLDPQLLAQPWKLLLPFDFGGARYRWTPTGFVLIGLVNLVVPAPWIFVGLLGVLVVVAYTGSWILFRSRIFSSTLAICLGFGSQFNYSYVHSGGHLWVLFVLYMLINLFFLYALATRAVGSGLKIGFVVSLIVFALCWEQWLDYCAFLISGCAFFYMLIRRHPELREQYLGRVRFVGLATIMVTVGYLAGKLPSSGEHLTRGHESDTIFTYRYPVMGVEDVISNVVSYPYIAVTNYLPSCFVSSNSLYHHGAEKLVEEQNRYHAEQTQLVVMHHMFLWHFYAGMVFVALTWMLVGSVRKVWSSPGEGAVLPLVLLWLIATGFTTHAIIKFRPYLSAPFLAYKCIGSVLGVALLLSYGLMQAGRLFTNPGKYVAAVLGMWLVLLIAGVERFHHNNHLSQQVGLGEYPSPTRQIRKLLRQVFQPAKGYERGGEEKAERALNGS